MSKPNADPKLGDAEKSAVGVRRIPKKAAVGDRLAGQGPAKKPRPDEKDPIDIEKDVEDAEVDRLVAEAMADQAKRAREAEFKDRVADRVAVRLAADSNKKDPEADEAHRARVRREQMIAAAMTADRKDYEGNMVAAFAASAALPLAGGFSAGVAHPAEGPEATGRSSLFLSPLGLVAHTLVCCFCFCLLTSAHRCSLCSFA